MSGRKSQFFGKYLKKVIGNLADREMLCYKKALRVRGKRSAFLNSAYQKTIRTPKKMKKKIKKYSFVDLCN